MHTHKILIHNIQPKQRGKLLTLVEKILESKTATHGQTVFKTKFIGLDKVLWLCEKDFSKGVIPCYNLQQSLPKSAKGRIDRYYYNLQQLYFRNKKNGLSIAKTSVGDIREAITRDPIKLEKRSARWIITAQQYVRSLNRVLSSGTTVLLKERERLIISQLKPPKTVLSNLNTEHFLSGRLQIHKGKDKVLKIAHKKPGCLTCTVCAKTFNWSKCDRMIMHITGTKHHLRLREINNQTSTATSRTLMTETSKTVLGE